MPPSALEILETVAESFSGKALKGSMVYKLEAFHVRRAMHHAEKAAKSDQIPAALYLPKAGDSLVILKADDLADLLSHVEQRGAGR